MPARPKPLYSFFPIYSPFKVNDDDGFYMGEDNRIKSIEIKDGALQFEVRPVLAKVVSRTMRATLCISLFRSLSIVLAVECSIATRTLLGQSLFGVYAADANIYHYHGSSTRRHSHSSPE